MSNGSPRSTETSRFRLQTWNRAKLGICLSAGLLGWAGEAARAQSAPSCLSQPGPLLTISGLQTSNYDDTSLAPSTKIDARTASWYALGDTPVQFGGGSGLCWSGGFVQGDYPLDASWDTTHPTASLWLTARNVVIENFHGVTYGDGIKLYEGTENFTVRGVLLEDMRDDCIEGDWLPGGLIEDSLLNGCYVTFAFRFRSGDATSDGSARTVEIRNTLAWMRDQIGVYKGTSPGHSMFFKWPTESEAYRGLKISMHDTILRVDSAVSESSRQFELPPGKLVSCSNNIIVWGGSGPVPSELAAWPSCFTITTDMSVWSNAVATWRANHGYGGTGGEPPAVVQNLHRTDKH